MAIQQRTEFQREITTFQLTMICVGAIIGAGVFSLTGVGIQYAGSAAFFGLGVPYYFVMVATMKKAGRNYRDMKHDYDAFWVEGEARLAAAAPR